MSTDNGSPAYKAGIRVGDSVIVIKGRLIELGDCQKLRRYFDLS